LKGGQNFGSGLKSAYSGAHPLCRPILDMRHQLHWFLIGAFGINPNPASRNAPVLFP
jgi:hypothetical protein